jgi:predicted metalloendopeptidase
MKARHVLGALGIAAMAGVVASAQPQLQSGIDLTNRDAAIRPQDDMFRYVNGAWLTKTEIPADRANYGSFSVLFEDAEADVQALIQEQAALPNRQPGSVAQQVGDLYASFMDEAAAERLGATPIRAHLAEIDAVKNTGELATVIGRLSMIGNSGAIGGYITGDKGDPTKTALYLVQSGIAMPDRDYYLKDDARFVDARAKYQEYLERIFTLTNRPNPREAARAVLEFETALARAQWTNVDARDAEKTYNRYAIAKVVQEMPGFDWMAWGREQGMTTVAEWIVEQPSFFKAFAALVPSTPLDTLKSWLAAQLITTEAPLLSKLFVDAHFEFFSRTLSGQQENRARWKRGVQFVNGSIGEAVGKLYVAKHFPPASKARMQTLVANLLEAYRQSISELDWMTPDTKKEALAKLAKISTKIGYPDQWRDYSTLTIAPGDLVGNSDRARRFENERQIAKLGKPVDRTEWLMTPQTVNAYFEPSANEIAFPAAILQPPFFNPAADDAVNYGGIGAVIGHEIGHAFDDQGSKYDGDGRLRDWWTPEDAAQFKKRTAKLVEQFNAYEPLPGLHINGELTLGENIGDLGGLSIAYRAWKISLAGKQAPVIDGLTGDQRYFMGWAQIWRAKARPQYLQRQVAADPHSWTEFRANGPLSNFQGFYDAYGLKPGDKLYRAPEDRVKIW